MENYIESLFTELLEGSKTEHMSKKCKQMNITIINSKKKIYKKENIIMSYYIY